MSLRIKFLSLLVVIPSLCLGLFLYFAISTFIKDKKSNLFENQFQLLNSASLYLSQAGPENFSQNLENLKKQEGFESLVVVNSTGTLLSDGSKTVKDILGDSIFEKLVGQSAGEGSFEALDQRKEKQLVSFLKFGKERPVILLLHSLSQGATRASTLFLVKALSTFLALISLAVVVSLLFSSKLTSGIQTLSKAMSDFGQGHFESKLPSSQSQDEVGAMTRQFDMMRTQIKGLIHEKEEKTKIETEMRLAGELQKSFLPDPSFQIQKTEFAGYYEPAHDAGGDWWFYFTHENEFIFLIGDVTGHGLNSAMLTGAARSAFSLISENYKGPGESMRQLNKVIYESVSGKLNMTCVIASLNVVTGEISYASASHEPPIVIPALDQELKKKDLNFLLCEGGPRLGEQPKATYKEEKMQLNDGDCLLFFTDGLTDLQDPAQESLGERRLFKIIGENHNKNLNASEILNKVKIKALQFRSTAELIDDLSFFTVKWRKTNA